MITSNANVVVDENQTAVTTVTASDADGDTPTFSITGGDDAGRFSIDANSGVLTFRVAPDFENPLDNDGDGTYQVQVTADDGNGGSAAQLISVTVSDVNEAPRAVNDGLSTAEDTPLVITPASDLLANDSDPDAGDSLAITGFTQPANGTLVDNGDNTWTYTPNANFNGNDSFSYTVTDNSGLTDTATVTIDVGGVNDIPRGLPAITGVASEGQQLWVDTSNLRDSDGLGTFSYQWLRNGTRIEGATDETYSLEAGDIGSRISVQVSYTDLGGMNEGPLESLPTAPVMADNEAPVGLPTISGEVIDTHTLTANTSGITDADGLGTFSYQWLRDGSTIHLATGPSYTLNFDDVGSRISIQVSYTDAQGHIETVTSTETLPVAPNANHPPKGTPLISGFPVEGERLEVITSIIDDPDGTGVFQYQWKRNGQEIKGENNRHYVIKEEDAGALIGVTVRYTDGAGHLEELQAILTERVSRPIEEDVTIRPDISIDPVLMASELNVHPLKTEIIEGFNSTSDATPETQNISNASLVPETSQDTSGVNEESVHKVTFGRSAASGHVIQTPPPIVLNDALLVTLKSGSVIDLNSHDADHIALKKGSYSPPEIKISILKPLPRMSPEVPEYPSVLDDSRFVAGLDGLEQNLDMIAEEKGKQIDLNIDAATGISFTLTAGFVSWALRTGSLLSSFLSVIPLWKQFDPLPILGAEACKSLQKGTGNRASEQNHKSQAEEQEKLEALFEDNNPRS